MLATENGWVCPEQCGYTRTMAEDWMPLVCSTAEEVAVQRLKDILTTRGYGAVVQEMMQLAKDNDELRFELTVLKEKMAIRGRGRPPKRKK